MMDKAEKEKMFGFMLEMCGKNMSSEEQSKMKAQMEACFKSMAGMLPHCKDMFRSMSSGIKSCCPGMNAGAFKQSCCAGPDETKTGA
jgi:hypothetical protein